MCTPSEPGATKGKQAHRTGIGIGIAAAVVRVSPHGQPRAVTVQGQCKAKTIVLIQRQIKAVAPGVTHTKGANFGGCKGTVEREKMHCTRAGCGTGETTVVVGANSQRRAVTADGNTATQPHKVALTQRQTACAGVVVANGANMHASRKTDAKAE